MQAIRIIAAALLAALLAAPAVADPEAVDQQACSEYCAPLEDPASDSDDAASTGAGAANTEELEDPSERQQPVIYVPPSRGTAQARVGGANRGGQHPL